MFFLRIVVDEIFLLVEVLFVLQALVDPLIQWRTGYQPNTMKMKKWRVESINPPFSLDGRLIRIAQGI